MTSPQLILPTDNPPAFYNAVGDVYQILADTKRTGGTYCLLEARVYPGGGPPPHLHRREEESFHVLEGEITFTVNEETLVAGRGDFIQIPRGTPHAFRNNGRKAARMLILCTPGGFDEFLLAIATPWPSPDALPAPPTPQEIDTLHTIAPRFGIEMLQPAAT